MPLGAREDSLFTLPSLEEFSFWDIAYVSTEDFIWTKISITENKSYWKALFQAVRF